METRIYPYEETSEQPIQAYVEAAEKCLFFDIETTGLSSKTAFIYLIGCASYSDGSWTLRQWLAQDMSQEEDILQSFLQYAGGYQKLIHFNGAAFDLPFVLARCKKYGIPISLAQLEQLDLYRAVSPLKNLLKLPNCKQKTLEEFLQLFRKDPFTGGQLIELYKVYRTQRDHRLLEVLLLHNADDLRGMLSVVPVLAYPALFQGRYSVTQARLNRRDLQGGSSKQVSVMQDLPHKQDLPDKQDVPGKKELLMTLKLELPIPVPFSFSGHGCSFFAHNNEGLLKIPVTTGELKYFYPDYKNYSYLPEEDTAIHKSVAIYVDKSHRQPATPATCYTRKTGDFLPQRLTLKQKELFAPAFRADVKDKECYFLIAPDKSRTETESLSITDLFPTQEEAQSYAAHILQGMIL